ncbi:MAG: TVP38/TMEM64 family protein [Verrucomicrobia bacterium]|nr:TVP38/TMEM64 family protein [Verrucomicrobiota bacterium]
MKSSWKWITIAAVVVCLLAAARLLPIVEWLRSFSAWSAKLGAFGFFAFVVVYALDTILFLPGWPLTLAAGFTFGLLLGTAAVSLGSILGAALAFLLGRFVARGMIESLTKRNQRFRALDRAIGKEGWKIIFLLRLSPLIPFSIGNYFYGITAVRFWPYFFASWIGMLPGTVLYVYVGTIGKAGVVATAGAKHGWEYWTFLSLGLGATVFVTIWVTKIARAALRTSAEVTS